MGWHVQVSEAEWNTLYEGLKRRTGIDLNLYKQDQMRRRILSMADFKGMTSLGEFGKKVTGTDEDVRWFLDKIAINVSELFRNPEKWVELEKVIFPTLLKQNNRLKIWSAGCSYGAEAHSFAALLEARFPGQHSIVGTDIDQSALDQARSGLFGPNDLRAVPADIRDGYFEKQGDNWLAKPSLKKYLTFKTGNLLADKFDSGFDLIACRNVVIYFNDTAKDDLYRRFYSALKPGGILFVGSTERIFNSKELGFETPIPFFYQKPTAQGEQQRWRNAS